MNFLSHSVLLYADPGAGALIVQLLMAGLFGALFFVRRVRNAILGLFGKKGSHASPSGKGEAESLEGESETQD